MSTRENTKELCIERFNSDNIVIKNVNEKKNIKKGF